MKSLFTAKQLNIGVDVFPTLENNKKEEDTNLEDMDINENKSAKELAWYVLNRKNTSKFYAESASVWLKIIALFNNNKISMKKYDEIKKIILKKNPKMAEVLCIVRMYRDKTFMEKYPKLMYIPIILGFILLWYIVGYIIIFFNTN